MRDKPHDLLEKGRIWRGPYASPFGEMYGAFYLKSPTSDVRLLILASDGTDEMPWEHVSVSAPERCPTWEEMCFVKDKFWLPHETVMQLHPPESEYVNNHRFCLHMWKPKNETIPLPPSIAVGVKDLGLITA